MEKLLNIASVYSCCIPTFAIGLNFIDCVKDCLSLKLAVGELANFIYGALYLG